MDVNFLFILISFALAGSQFESSSSKLLAAFNEKIELGDIHSLQSFINTNSNYIQSKAVERYRNDGLILAVQKRHTSVVELLLSEANVDAASNNNRVIRLASANGDVEIVRMLLHRPEVNPGVLNNEALVMAANNGHTEIVRLLLASPKFDPSTGGVFASAMNHPDIVRLLINDERVLPTIFKFSTLEQAARHGIIDLVRFLLGYPYFSHLAHSVILQGDLLSIGTLVEAGYKIDQETLYTTLQYAKSRGNAILVGFLESLEYAFFTDVAFSLSEKIIMGDAKSVQSILHSVPNYIQSKAVERYRNDGLILAVQKRHTSVVELLLSEANVDAASNNNRVIRLASANGDVEIVRMLLHRPEVNPGVLNNEALVMAANNGHTEIVRLLLASPKVDPSINGGQAVFLASERNHPDIVRLIINDGRAEPFVLLTHTLEKAAHFGNVDLVRFLLSYPSFVQVVHFVIFNGDLISIRTLVDAGYKFDQETLSRTLEYARSRGDNNIVEYLESLKEPPRLAVKPLISMTEQCAICLTDGNLLAGYMTSCHHQFHVDCLQKWMEKQPSCPMCRALIN